MRKLILFIMVINSALIFGQNQVNVYKATVTGWIIYKGDTLALTSVSQGATYDTLFIIRGNTLDTLILPANPITQLNDLSDVTLTTPDSWDVLRLNDESNQWINVPLAEYGDAIDSARAAAPTAYTTWVRDSTAGILSPATATDYFKGANFKYSVSDASTMIGYNSGVTGLKSSTGVGQGAFYNVTAEDRRSTAVGANAGSGLTFSGGLEAAWVDCYGYNAGINAQSYKSIFIGAFAGGGSIGGKNTFVGHSAGYLYTGSYTTTLGWEAGANSSGDTNIMIVPFAKV